MRQLVRILFIAFGIIGPIFIGALHTFTHFSQLISSEIRETLSAQLLINGQLQTYWHSWGIMSFMMGISMIIIGLLNLFTYRRLLPVEFPPTSTIGTMMLFLACVIYAGNEFEQAPQVYLGIIGFLSLGVCLFFSWRSD